MTEANDDKEIVPITTTVVQTSRIYIGNLDYSTTEDELYEYLKEYNVCSVLVPSHTVRGFRSNHVRPLGIGYAEFESHEVAKDIVEKLNTKPFKGRDLKVKLYVPFTPENVCTPKVPVVKQRRLSRLRRTKKENPKNFNVDVINKPVNKEKPSSIDTVYCGYLPKNTTDSDLREHFQEYNPQEIWIFRTRATKGPIHLQLHRHYTAALITLNTTEEITKVAEVTSLRKLLGKKISVKPAYLSKIQEVKKIAEQTGITQQNPNDDTNVGIPEGSNGNETKANPTCTVATSTQITEEPETTQLSVTAVA